MLLTPYGQIMLTPAYKKDPLNSAINSTLVQLPAPVNLSSLWNIGSLLSICLIIQIITGVLLASSYSPSISNRFYLVNFITENSDKGWLIRYIHANGASLFFICIYTHIGRGIYYKSYFMVHTWIVGVTIIIITIAAAFLGYVLPVNQISFWGASVITNLFSEVPYIGPELVQTIWGGPLVRDPTIIRFFTFHFIIPFIILALTIVHIIYLHTTGSSNNLGVTSVKKLIFHPFLSIKDIVGVFIVLIVFLYICLHQPLVLGDDENFVLANPSVTPHHIQPEWYFLFAYAILRSIPNKIGGVIALALSVIVLYTLPFTSQAPKKRTNLQPSNKIMFWILVGTVLALSWIGARPVEEPFILVGQLLTVLYFSFFILSPIINKK